MKIILNKSYGGFEVDEKWEDVLGIAELDEEELRFSEPLIKAIESNFPVDGYSARLEVITIPSNATDFAVINNDGFETVIYVVDGKLYRA